MEILIRALPVISMFIWIISAVVEIIKLSK